MSISTPDSNQGKDEQRETSKENAAPPRPSARRSRRGGTAAPKSDPHAGSESADDSVAGEHAAKAENVTEAAESDADATDLESTSDVEYDKEAADSLEFDGANETDGEQVVGEDFVDDTDEYDSDEDDSEEYDDSDEDDAEYDDDVDDAAELAEDDAEEDAEDDDEPGEDPDEDAKLLAEEDAAPVKAPKPSRIDATPVAQQSSRAGAFGVQGSGDTSGFGGLRIHAGSGIPSRSTDRPYGGYFDEVADRFAKAYSSWRQALIATVVDRGEITFYVEKSHIARIMKVARDDTELRFELLSSLSGVDYYRGDAGISSTGDPKQDEYVKQRLHVVYHLLSMTFRRRVRFEVATTVEDPHVPSVSDVYPTADWQEREAYDMFGVVFDGHHALTRILMPDDWDGFPQRKDYPLGGIPVEYHDATIPPPDQRRAYK